jgi:hypothetical protein
MSLFRSSRSVWLRITGYFFFIMGRAYPLCPSVNQIKRNGVLAGQSLA